MTIRTFQHTDTHSLRDALLALRSDIAVQELLYQPDGMADDWECWA